MKLGKIHSEVYFQLLAINEIMACDLITLEKNTYESLQQELVELRKIISQLQTANPTTHIPKQKEIAVCNSVGWFTRMADNVPGMIYEFQLFVDGSISFPYVSSGCREMLEIEPSQIYENPEVFFAMVYPEDIFSLQQAIAISSQTLQNSKHEWRIITPSGKHKWLKGISKPQRQLDGSIIWDGCIIDVTERKQTEAALKLLNDELEAKVKERTFALSQSEARLQRLADNVPAMIFEFRLNPDGAMSFLFVSSGCREVLEIEPEDLYEDASLAFAQIHPSDIIKVHEELARSSQTLENYEYEWRIITDGKEKWIRGVARPIRQQGGEILWYGSLIDISKQQAALKSRQQAEAQLKVKEQFLRSIYDGVQYSIFVIDVRDNNEFYSAGWNSYAEKATGKRSVDVVGKSLREIFGTIKAVELDEKCHKCCEAGVAISFEECITLRGQETWLLTTFNPLKDSEGKIYQLVGTTLDITERKLAEEALKASQHFIERVTNSIPNTIYIYDLEEQRNVYANHEIAIILGYSVEEIQKLGASILTTTLHPDDEEKVLNYHQKFSHAVDGEVLELEYRMKDADGKWRWLYSRDTSFNRTPQGKVKQILGVATDITARKQVEIQLQQQTEYLENTLSELQCTQTQLIQSEKMSSLGNMVAGVAHEINNPVNFIHGNVIPACEYTQDLLRLIELYQQYYPNPEAEIQEQIEDIDLDFIKEDLVKLLGSMRVGTQRIREIVLSLRNFSRLDEAEFKRVDLHEGIDSTLMILHNRLKGKLNHPEISVIKEYGKLPAVECYPGQLNQVFMNILANSIDALEDSFVQEKEQGKNPEIRICTSFITDKIAIEISDNGFGIPPEILSKLFDPFFTTKDVGKGTGLGLSISYQIVVDKHSGKLSCDSIPGKGAKFLIEIPVNQPNAL